MMASRYRAVLLAAVAVMMAMPAFAQVPVYSNANLGKAHTPRHVITPEEYRSLVAHQFVYVPPRDPWRERGPQVLVISNVPSVPPPPFAIPRRLDGTLVSHPVTLYGDPFLWHRRMGFADWHSGGGHWPPRQPPPDVAGSAATAPVVLAEKEVPRAPAPAPVSHGMVRPRF